MNKSEEFLVLTTKSIANKDLYVSQKQTVNTLNIQVEQLIAENYNDLTMVKKRAEALKSRAIENLERNLIDFEYSFSRRGGKIVWAFDKNDLQKELLKIVQKGNKKLHIASANQLIKEVELDDFVLKNGLSLSDDQENTVNINVADFIISDIGAIVIANNQSKVQSKVTITIATIDSVLPKIADVDLFLPLLSIYKDVKLSYNKSTIIFGRDEANGQENYLFILDNGRSNLLEKVDQRKALFCIHCDACSRACPIWRNIGSDSYGSFNTGPIGSVINQFQVQDEDFKHLSNVSTLCGSCSSVCPVNIDIHNQLLNNRRDNIEDGFNSKSESIALYFWKTNMLKRSKMEKGGQKVKNFMLRQFFKKQWGDKREFPTIQAKSFNQLWREKNNM